MNESYTKNLTEFFERLSSWEDGIVRDTGISLPQMHLIEVVGNHEALRMKDLADKLGVTTGTLTVMIDRLSRKGYVERLRDDMDRRSYFITLTDPGREHYRNHHRMHDGLIADICDLLGESESERFFAQLHLIQSIL